ncbi:Alpha/Beta hydrolase protein [Pilaira anomala]|nr:Alpha/Beta hydrolase protein [Pilaira anomala]
MRLIPTSTHVIPVHSATDGWETQKLAVERHEVPAKTKANRKVAFLFSHSNGFHKESLHPLIKRFIDHLRSLKEYDQTDITIVAWDARSHGDSARLNEGTFLESYRWFDNAMDTKKVIEEMELDQGYDQLIGVGHSFGATSMIILEFFYPNTFDGLCVTEPVFADKLHDGEIRAMIPTLASGKRRDEWPNREECRKSLLKSKFFQSFHPEVLDNYVNYGMYDTEKGTIKLKCPKECEYHIFKYYNYDTYVAFKSLQLLKVPTHFVFANGSNFAGLESTNSIADQNPEKITLEYVDGSHMVPNETPEVLLPHIMKTIAKVNNNSTPIKSKL